MFLLFLLSCSSALTCREFVSGNSYTAQEAFECINSVATKEGFTTEFLGYVKSLFETYVYKDIVKNPPQPSFDEHYFTAVDIDERLNAVNLAETKLYTFYQQVKKIFFDIHDLHLSLYLRSSLFRSYTFDSFYYYLPFKMHIEGDKKVHLIPNDPILNVTIPEIFEKNKEVEVVAINGDLPLIFIRKYGEQHTGLKSHHGRFTYALESFSFGSLASDPLEEEYLSTPIEIEWSNGEKTTINYRLLYVSQRSLSKKAQRSIELRTEGKVFSPLTPKDFEDTFKQAKASVFDFESPDATLACKTFNEEGKKINMLVLKTFYPQEGADEFFDVFEKCVAQFDGNNYPISVILPMNGGGYTDLESNLENVLAPHSDTTFIGSVRISNGTEGCLVNGYAASFADPKNCSARMNDKIDKTQVTDAEWYSNPVTDLYGNVEHKRTQPSLAPPHEMLKGRLTKNPRKPQEIVVFTDGFCYSACSMLAKGLREKGNAIIVGFEGDPDVDDSLFDAGQSPTFVISEINTLSQDAIKLRKLGGSMQISFFETYRFNYDYNETVPREFLIDPVNERVNIYRYEETNINSFADEALRIIKKYETECDSNNKRLVKVDASCDDNITIEHAHGGYVCGDDNKWTTTCVASYCDNGYKFDYENQKCIEDVCFPPKEDKSEDSKSGDDKSGDDKSEDDPWNIWIIVGFSVGALVVLVVLLAIGIFIIVFSVKKMKSKYEVLE